MNQKTLSRWLRAVIAGMAVCGAAVYGVVFPMVGRDLSRTYPEFAGWFRPWLAFLWASGVPCFAVLVCGRRIAVSIGRGRSFTRENAALLRRISAYSAGDSAFFFVGNLALLLCGLNHPAIVLFSLFVVFSGAAVTVAAAAASHLVLRAAVLREDSDLTI